MSQDRTLLVFKFCIIYNSTNDKKLQTKISCFCQLPSIVQFDVVKFQVIKPYLLQYLKRRHRRLIYDFISNKGFLAASICANTKLIAIIHVHFILFLLLKYTNTCLINHLTNSKSKYVLSKGGFNQLVICQKLP